MMRPRVHELVVITVIRRRRVLHRRHPHITGYRVAIRMWMMGHRGRRRGCLVPRHRCCFLPLFRGRCWRPWTLLEEAQVRLADRVTARLRGVVWCRAFFAWLHPGLLLDDRDTVLCSSTGWLGLCTMIVIARM